jgi:hypothetical protein
MSHSSHTGRPEQKIENSVLRDKSVLYSKNMIQFYVTLVNVILFKHSLCGFSQNSKTYSSSIGRFFNTEFHPKRKINVKLTHRKRHIHKQSRNFTAWTFAQLKSLNKSLWIFPISFLNSNLKFRKYEQDFTYALVESKAFNSSIFTKIKTA